MVSLLAVGNLIFTSRERPMCQVGKYTDIMHIFVIRATIVAHGAANLITENVWQ